MAQCCGRIIEGASAEPYVLHHMRAWGKITLAKAVTLLYNERMKAAMPLEMQVSRELTPEDMLVRSATPVNSKPAGLKQLRAVHHKLAQQLAMGVKEGEASLATGYSLSRISILKADPAFQELMAFYQGSQKEAYVDVVQRMAGLATTAVEVMQERLEEHPDGIATKDLNSILKTAADRGGYSPVRKSEHKSVMLTAEDLKSMKEEVESKQNGQIRTINQEEETQRVKSLLEDNKEPANVLNDNRPSSDVQEPSEVQGSEGEGDDL